MILGLVHYPGLTSKRLLLHEDAC